MIFFYEKLSVIHSICLFWKVFYVGSLAHSLLLRDNFNFLVSLGKSLENSFKKHPISDEYANAHHKNSSVMPNHCYTNLAENDKKRAHTSTSVKNARVLLTGTPCSISTLGFIIVTSWCRRSGWDSNSSGANSFITSSSCSAA